MENELIKEAVDMDVQKVDSARALVAGVMHWGSLPAASTVKQHRTSCQERWTPLRQRASGVSSGVADR